MIDQFSDRGALLKDAFGIEKVSHWAQGRPEEDGWFAMPDERLFPVNTPENTVASALYFATQIDSSDIDLEKVAEIADRILDAIDVHEVDKVYEDFVKRAVDAIRVSPTPLGEILPENVASQAKAPPGTPRQVGAVRIERVPKAEKANRIQALQDVMHGTVKAAAEVGETPVQRRVINALLGGGMGAGGALGARHLLQRMGKVPGPAAKFAVLPALLGAAAGGATPDPVTREERIKEILDDINKSAACKKGKTIPKKYPWAGKKSKTKGKSEVPAEKEAASKKDDKKKKGTNTNIKNKNKTKTKTVGGPGESAQYKIQRRIDDVMQTRHEYGSEASNAKRYTERIVDAMKRNAEHERFVHEPGLGTWTVRLKEDGEAIWTPEPEIKGEPAPMAETLSKEPKDLYLGHRTGKSNLGKEAGIKDVMAKLLDKAKPVAGKMTQEIVGKAAPIKSVLKSYSPEKIKEWMLPFLMGSAAGAGNARALDKMSAAPVLDYEELLRDTVGDPKLRNRLQSYVIPPGIDPSSLSGKMVNPHLAKALASGKGLSPTSQTFIQALRDSDVVNQLKGIKAKRGRAAMLPALTGLAGLGGGLLSIPAAQMAMQGGAGVTKTAEQEKEAQNFDFSPLEQTTTDKVTNRLKQALVGAGIGGGVGAAAKYLTPLRGRNIPIGLIAGLPAAFGAGLGLMKRSFASEEEAIQEAIESYQWESRKLNPMERRAFAQAIKKEADAHYIYPGEYIDREAGTVFRKEFPSMRILRMQYAQTFEDGKYAEAYEQLFDKAEELGADKFAEALYLTDGRTGVAYNWGRIPDPVEVTFGPDINDPNKNFVKCGGVLVNTVSPLMRVDLLKTFLEPDLAEKIAADPSIIENLTPALQTVIRRNIQKLAEISAAPPVEGQTTPTGPQLGPAQQQQPPVQAAPPQQGGDIESVRMRVAQMGAVDPAQVSDQVLMQVMQAIKSGLGSNPESMRRYVQAVVRGDQAGAQAILDAHMAQPQQQQQQQPMTGQPQQMPAQQAPQMQMAQQGEAPVPQGA